MTMKSGQPDWWTNEWASGQFPPPTVLSYVALNSVADGRELVPAPGAGKALRLFIVSLDVASNATPGDSANLSMGTLVFGCMQGHTLVVPLGPIGVIGPSNTHLQFNAALSNTNFFVAYDIVATG